MVGLELTDIELITFHSFCENRLDHSMFIEQSSNHLSYSSGFELDLNQIAAVVSALMVKVGGLIFLLRCEDERSLLLFLRGFCLWPFWPELKNANKCNTKKTVAVFLDLEKTFDRIWHEGLLHKLLKLKTPT